LSAFVALDGAERVVLDGVGIDPVTEADVVATVCAALDRGEGGRIVTPNVDILRLARTDPAVRAHLDDATLVVADGMPLVWASRLAGTPLPERVPGSSLIWSLSYHLGRAGRSVYLLGGLPGETAGGRRAAAVLAAGCPGLRVAGSASPPYGFEADPARLADVCAGVVEAKPDLVFVGLGFPKQERLIDALRPELPLTWFLGCGAAINFVAGDRARAPQWMQQAGLEWAWRLAGDPRRLAGRYLRHDAPYAVRLLASALRGRLGGRRSSAVGAPATGPRGS
jgi:N-acetylglucosaminyldiphosphoundecaprenol N-acetyl-beta-D-mannosaminyltransferase